MLTRRDIFKALAAIPVVGWLVPKAVAKPPVEPMAGLDTACGVWQSLGVARKQYRTDGHELSYPVQVNPGDEIWGRCEMPSGKTTLIVRRVGGRIDEYPCA